MKKNFWKGKDEKKRCRWCGDAAEFLSYHDSEWGYPVVEDQELFEKLCLESFQSGLSWRTILAKRDGFRSAFAGFDVRRISKFTEKDVARLLCDASIVRHRGKIEATIHNARRALDLIQKQGSLGAFFWQFEIVSPKNVMMSQSEKMERATELSKRLKKEGWKFVGPTTVYSFMQAAGLLNDHVEECYVRSLVEVARRRFKPPGC